MWWVLLLAAYLLGSVPFGYLIGREGAGVDVRKVGSGNVGATNVLRVAGKRSALAVLILDLSKGCLPVLLGRVLGAPMVVLGAVAVVAVVGHVFPVWLGFRGGKGVATAIGAFLPLALPAALGAIGVFGLVLAWKRYVSLASVVSAISFPLWVSLLGSTGWLKEPWWPVLVAGTAVATLIVIRHRENLRRIQDDSESRIGERLEVRSK
jgi:glycerol-3-phosphate acyltransferase PlsY